MYFGECSHHHGGGPAYIVEFEALDKSKETEAKAMGLPVKQVVEEPRKKKNKHAKVVAKSVSILSVKGKPVETSSTLAEVPSLWMLWVSGVSVCSSYSSCKEVLSFMQKLHELFMAHFRDNFPHQK